MYRTCNLRPVSTQQYGSVHFGMLWNFLVSVVKQPGWYCEMANCTEQYGLLSSPLT